MLHSRTITHTKNVTKYFPVYNMTGELQPANDIVLS